MSENWSENKLIYSQSCKNPVEEGHAQLELQQLSDQEMDEQKKSWVLKNGLKFLNKNFLKPIS